MDEYLLQGPPAYKRARLDNLQPTSNFLDARANMVPYGFFSGQGGEADLNMAAMTMSYSLSQNPDFGPPSVGDWRCSITNDIRTNFISKISQLLLNGTRSAGENSDNRMKRSNTANNIEKQIFKTATSRSQYFNMMKEEIHKLELGYVPASSSQFFASSSTTSAAAANNLQLLNMQQNYGPNGFGDAVSATQSHSQPGIAHSATSVNLFPENSVGGGGGGNSMRIPVTSSIGSARPQYDAFNGGRPIGPRSMVRDQVPSSSLPLGDPSQFMSNADQVIVPGLLHSINPLMTTPLNHFVPSSTIGSQQRFGGDSSQGVLSENISISNSQMSGPNSPKEWHKSMSFIIRNNIIRKMAQMLAAIPQPDSSDNRVHQHCINIATQVENETFRLANSQTQYYDIIVNRCLNIAKERANMSQAGMQYYQKHMQDLRWTYENLGITFPGAASYPPNRGGGGNVGGGINMRHDAPPPPPQPPQGSVIPNLMGSSGHPVGLPPPYPFARGQILPMPSGHNQLMDLLIQGSVPLSPELSEVPDVVKQLAHAYKCQERENQENDVMMLCSLPNCRETKTLLNHIQTCQIGIACCGSTKEIIEHWNRCSLSECPICLPVRQAERSLNSISATSTSLNNHISPNYMGRRAHRTLNSSYPSTATSGLLSNQSQSSSGPNSLNMGRNEQRIRSSMWHSNYNDTWQRPPGIIPDINNPIDTNRRYQRWSYNRNNGNRNDSRRHGTYPGQWPAMEMFFQDNIRGNPSIRSSNYIGPMISNRSIDRLQPYGAPWRAPEILFAENNRPAHRHAPESDEPVIIAPEEEATPTDHQTMMAIVKVIKTQGGRLEQKFRCSRRSCNASWPCLHRRLAASNQSPQTPIPG